MARVPLIDPEGRSDLSELVDRIRSGRRGSLIGLYRLLLNSPPLAETWFDHLNAVRWDTTLTGRMRELVVIRVGNLNNAAYILRQHVPRLALPEGVSEEECAALADWRASGLFSDAERAILAYVDAVTLDVTVPDDVFEALAAHMPDARQIVELTVLIGTYNMHARVVCALELDLEPLQG